jgi:transcriptional regulator with XRE-family HTH domain
MTTSKAVGVRLRMFRLQAGLTQEDLAKLCEVSVSTISAAEVSRRGIRLPTLLQICKALNIRPEQLTEEKDRLEESPETARAAAFKDLLERHQESEKNLLLFLYEVLESRGGERFSLGESGSVALGRQAGTPRARSRSRRKS